MRSMLAQPVGLDPVCFAIRAHQRPVAQPQPRIVGGGLGDAEAGAGDALVVPLAALGQVAEGGVGEHELRGGEAAAGVGGHAGVAAKEGDLEAELAPVGHLQRTGEIPPLGAGVGVGAEVGREFERPGRHRGVRLPHTRPQRRQGGRSGHKPQQFAAFHAAKLLTPDDNAGFR